MAVQPQQVQPPRVQEGGSSALALQPAKSSPFARLQQFLNREGVFAYLLLAPALLVLLVFIAYPFILGIWLSLTDKQAGNPGKFIGLDNFVTDLQDPIFQRVVANTFAYTIITTIFKFVFGLALALLMNQKFFAKNIVRAVVLLPWIVPTVLSTLAWQWMFDPNYSVLNWMLKNWFSWKGAYPNWLGDQTLALVSVMLVNIWRGIPFFAISILAGLQAVSLELHEAAAIDGANVFQRFWAVTLPSIRPVLLIVTLFSVVWTFADFQIVYVLTNGGPANSTHLFATYSYQTGLNGGQLGLGASIALFMFPILAVLVIFIQRFLKKEV